MKLYYCSNSNSILYLNKDCAGTNQGNDKVYWVTLSPETPKVVLDQLRSIKKSYNNDHDGLYESIEVLVDVAPPKPIAHLVTREQGPQIECLLMYMVIPSTYKKEISIIALSGIKVNHLYG